MKFTYLTFSGILLAGISSACTNSVKSQPKKPNVLFIIVDDLNDWIGPYGGHPQTITPNIDRLAANGAMTMMNAQCAGTVCGPSRSALLSGLRPSTTGVYGNNQNIHESAVAAGLPTISQYF